MNVFQIVREWVPVVAIVVTIVGWGISHFMSLGGMKARLKNNETAITEMKGSITKDGVPIFVQRIDCETDKAAISNEFCRKMGELKDTLEHVQRVVTSDSKQISKIAGSVETLIELQK